MFKDSFFVPEKRTFYLWVFPFSLLFHLCIFLISAVYPYLSAGRPPEITYMKALIAPPLPAPPPYGSSAPRKTANSGTRIRPVREAAPVKTGLVVPVDIPDNVAEEGLFFEESPFGIEGGDPKADPGGIPSGYFEGLITDILTEEDDPVRAGGTVKPPKLIKRVVPGYPEIARAARVEGTVILEATTDIFGRVVRVHILKSIPLLDEAAASAVRKWVYEPLLLYGKPRAVVFTVKIKFELNYPALRASPRCSEMDVQAGVGRESRRAVTFDDLVFPVENIVKLDEKTEALGNVEREGGV